MFHDRARIRVKGGRGGDGSLSFRREKYVPKGGPDGGDGGRGGEVSLVADPDLRDLSSLRRRGRYEAGRGRHGEGANRTGADGEDVELRVPVGTQVLDPDGRLLADAALLGFPNAGKSSLLRRLSNAKPKVADYPFTTLAPVLGTVDAPDGRQLTVADVPGLLEGASEGVGLGDEFLAHLERARLFIHVIEAPENVAARFDAIDRELAAYGAGLADRPQIVVLNKTDLVEEPPQFELDDERVLAVIPTSAVTGAGVDELERALFDLIPERGPTPAGQEELVDFLVYRPRPPRRRPYRIFRTDRGYRVVGGLSEDEARDALRSAGIRDPEIVEVE